MSQVGSKERFNNIGITGAAGHIGSVLRKGLPHSYTITAFTLEPASFPSKVVDFSQPEQVQGCFQGLEAVIHLAANPLASTPWKNVLKNNIDATYQVFEECLRAGVKRLVFASTNHVQNGETMLTHPDTLDPNKKIRMKLSDPPNPDSLYAVSKLTAEHLGKLYSHPKLGLEFVGLRIGATFTQDNPAIFIGTDMEDYMRAMFLSQRDCVQAFRRALEVDLEGKGHFLLAYAISRNDRRVFDLEETEVNLGFHPVDNAENYFRKDHQQD
ncbi:MAG: SDR family oxidoreductase [bacterium]|nr:SDR family oxidoreductase [bacterium]